MFMTNKKRFELSPGFSCKNVVVKGKIAFENRLNLHRK